MAMKEGEKYRCPNEKCGCEIQVTQGPKDGSLGENEVMRCCCGEWMEKV